jgi:hypothetical protein
MSEYYSVKKEFLDELSSSDGGFVQQTFLGASITDFTINAGFGDDTSTMSVNLVPDSVNSGDGYGLGLGDDVYHNGSSDQFRPPAVGSPVFFKFGSQLANVSQAFRKTYDDIYTTITKNNTLGYSASDFGSNPGHFHFSFGGILKAINETKDAGGNPKYSVQVADPREVLGNVELILNNYAGTTFNNPNMFNLYGFLEYNIPENMQKKLSLGGASVLDDLDPLRKIDNLNGSVRYFGTDMIYGAPSVIIAGVNDGGKPTDVANTYGSNAFSTPMFPLTGTGFSRRSSQGIPFYRVAQSLSALFGWYGNIPNIYVEAGFGGYIQFRGFNYVVDLSGLPELNQFYFLDYDKITLLDLLLEICEVSNHELIVSLLPIIEEHPACNIYKTINDQNIQTNNMSGIIAGIIRIDTIDRSKPQPNGAIKSYIDNLESNGVEVTSKSFGSELSNVNTDKFVVGANETEMYYFSGNADRREADTRVQWDLDYSLKQQILPYYGTLPGNSDHPETVTIPKGFGSYQQILLDSSALNAVGVGNFYVATEMELRCATVSFKRWCEFLLQYDAVYMESTEENDIEEGAALTAQIPAQPVGANPRISNNYAVSVPRSVWPSDENGYDENGLPLSACNPPYGYPLYYGRATQIGLPSKGQSIVSNAQKAHQKRVQAVTEVVNAANEHNDQLVQSQAEFMNNFYYNSLNFLTGLPGFGFLKPYKEKLDAAGYTGKDPLSAQAQAVVDEIKANNDIIIEFDTPQALADTTAMFSRVQRKGLKNARKVYDFVKSIADECLGKKFLVKMPKQVNLFYDKNVTSDGNGNIIQGPFGFPVRSVNQEATYVNDFSARLGALLTGEPSMRTYLVEDDRFTEPEDNFTGAMEVHYNPITGKYEFNYEPDTQGGFAEYDLLSNFSNSQPISVAQGLSPADVSIFDKGNSRIGAYVRFDHSQNLSFQGASNDSITQQQIQAGYFVPDLSYTLDNLSAGKLKDLPPANTSVPEQVTFLECTLDSKFYMPPQSSDQLIGVHAQQIVETYTLSPPKRIYSTSGCDYTDAMRFSSMVAVPKPGAGTLCSVRHFNSNIQFKQHQFAADTDHVYALITLPIRVQPTISSRLRDGALQAYNTANIKHNLGQDVVRGVCGFSQPALRGTPTNLHDEFMLQPLGDDAAAAVQKAKGLLSFGAAEKTNFTSPSPVYPDLVALPLQSKSRCYGPWVSSQVGGYSNIGGKIEYIKDENLAPWNFSGYDLMNKAGLIQAEFSNSLLLASERGSFSIPRAPSGVALARSLQSDGPLVSNISVSVSDRGVTTDYALDLYTASFGKLQKQRLDNISKIGRNQQKLEDERNALIRKGFGKNQTDISLQSIYNSLQKQIIQASNNTNFSLSPTQTNPDYKPNYRIMSVIPSIEEFKGDVKDLVTRGYNAVSSFMSAQDLQDTSDMMQDDENLKLQQYDHTASSKITDEKTPVSLEPGHTGMVSRPVINEDNTKEIVNNVDGFDDIHDLSTWKVNEGANEDGII